MNSCKIFLVLILVVFFRIDASRAKEALSDAEKALKTSADNKSNAEETLSRLFDPAWFGKAGEWKKLDNTCLEKNTGE